MALKTKIGFADGTSQSLSIAISVFDDSHATLDYNVALAAALNAAPPVILGSTVDYTNVSVTDQSHDCIVFDVGYKRPARNTLLLSDGAQTRPKKLYNFVAPVGVYDAQGDATSSYASLKWKPDRQGSVAEYNSGKPIMVDPLPVGPRFTFTTSQSFVTDPYVDTVKDLVHRGVFNDAPFLGRSLGTLQLVEFNITQRDDRDWEMVFGFGRRAFQADVAVGDGVTIPELRGCDHYWLEEVDTYASGSIQPKVKAAIVGQAWELADLTVLNLPYQGVLSTRTNNVTGVITTIYEHNLTSSDAGYICWDGGSMVANITGTSAHTVAFSSGVGDPLPALNRNILVAKYVP